MRKNTILPLGLTFGPAIALTPIAMLGDWNMEVLGTIQVALVGLGIVVREYLVELAEERGDKDTGRIV